MTIFQSLLLGVVQGLAEFLPISSSGHLALLEKLFGIKEPLSFSIILHSGTLFSVLIYFREQLINLTKEILTDFKNKKLNHTFLLVVIAILPVLLTGLFFKDLVDSFYSNLIVIGLSFFITSLLLFLAASAKHLQKSLNNITFKDSLIIGVFQAVAILPGVSRSGTTISASLFRHFKKADAFYFSFLISIPAIIGAIIFDSIESEFILSYSPISILVGIITSFFSGLVAIKILRKIIIQDILQYFAIYTFVIGVITILLA